MSSEIKPSKQALAKIAVEAGKIAGAIILALLGVWLLSVLAKTYSPPFWLVFLGLLGFRLGLELLGKLTKGDFWKVYDFFNITRFKRRGGFDRAISESELIRDEERQDQIADVSDIPHEEVRNMASDFRQING